MLSSVVVTFAKVSLDGAYTHEITKTSMSHRLAASEPVAYRLVLLNV